jgi:hypothetical protein
VEDQAHPAALIVARPTNVASDGEGDDRLLTIDWVYRLPAGAVPKQCWFRRTVGADVESVTEAFPAALHDDALKDKPAK